jgi:hypothetical protein
MEKREMLSDEDKTWIRDVLDGRLDAAEERMKAYADKRTDALETKLITAFQQWASPVEMRVRSHAAAIRAMDVEVESIADRVDKLEGK